MERHRPMRYERERWKGKTTFSASRLKSFLQCMHRYKLENIDKLRASEEERGQALKLGTSVHAVAEDVVEKIVRANYSGSIPVDRVLELFSRRAVEDGVRGLDWYALGESCVELWAAGMGHCVGGSVLGVESFFAIDTGIPDPKSDKETIHIIGYIDRLDDLGVRDGVQWAGVVDYKTGRHMPSQADVDESLQLGIYAWAVFELYPEVGAVEASFDMLRHGERVTCTYTRESVKQLQRYVKSVIGAAVKTEPESMKPTLNTLCSYCGVSKHCDAYKDALQSVSVTGVDMHDPGSLAREKERAGVLIGILKAHQSEIDKALKSHLDRCESVDGVSKRYVLGKRTSYNFNNEAVDVFEKVTGQSGSELYAVDRKKVKEAVTQYGKEHGKAKADLLMLELQAVASKRTTTYLRGVSKGE